MSRRVKVLVLDPRDVLNVFLLRTQDAGVLAVLTLPGLPPDAKVVSVNADWESHCFKVIVAHDSFDEVEDGAYPPRLESWQEIVAVEKLRREDFGPGDGVPTRRYLIETT